MPQVDMHLQSHSGMMQCISSYYPMSRQKCRTMMQSSQRISQASESRSCKASRRQLHAVMRICAQAADSPEVSTRHVQYREGSFCTSLRQARRCCQSAATADASRFMTMPSGLKIGDIRCKVSAHCISSCMYNSISAICLMQNLPDAAGRGPAQCPQQVRKRPAIPSDNASEHSSLATRSVRLVI